MFVTGADVAAIIGLPASTAATDSAAAVANQWISLFLPDPTIWPAPEPVIEAARIVAVDVYQNRTAPGGEPVGVDMQPGPYRMGKSLMLRVQGLLAPYRDPRSMVG